MDYTLTGQEIVDLNTDPEIINDMQMTLSRILLQNNVLNGQAQTNLANASPAGQWGVNQ